MFPIDRTRYLRSELAQSELMNYLDSAILRSDADILSTEFQEGIFTTANISTEEPQLPPILPSTRFIQRLEDIIKNRISHIPDDTLYESDDCPKCSICLSEIIKNDLVTVLKCGHLYHSACIRKWKNPTCPYCRAQF